MIRSDPGEQLIKAIEDPGELIDPHDEDPDLIGARVEGRGSPLQSRSQELRDPGTGGRGPGCRCQGKSTEILDKESRGAEEGGQRPGCESGGKSRGTPAKEPRGAEEGGQRPGVRAGVPRPKSLEARRKEDRDRV